ncbi:phosphotransferase [Actinospica durhamensis]|uniref:Phosphotransferase n=1 Tax=Actinospica durhamensis TaxID=1508375 RepID=A0A941INI3_9ACTN|nr:phosphotransferase [Actinospica durhamensis]MBR7835440.1 phosphotransferase [Actinospica durhamensis]
MHKLGELDPSSVMGTGRKRHDIAAVVRVRARNVVYIGSSAAPQSIVLAIKLARAGDAKGALVRVGREARALRLAQGPYVERLYDAQEQLAEPGPWLATGYVAAPSLTDLFHPRRPSENEPAYWADQQAVSRLAFGLATALLRIHAKGLVHGDVCPDNVLLGRDGPVLIDFEAADPQAPFDLTSTEYLDPRDEAARLHTPTGDVYALGQVLYAAVLGRDPTSVAADVHGLDTVQLNPRLLDAIRTCLETSETTPSPAKQAAKAKKTLQKLIAATERQAPGKGEAWWPGPVIQRIAALERERDATILAMQQRIARERAEAAKGTLPYGTPTPSVSGRRGGNGPGEHHSDGGRSNRERRGGGKTGRTVTGLVVVGVIACVAVALFDSDKTPPTPASSAPPYRFAAVGGVALSQTVSGESVPIAPGTALKACTAVSVTVRLKNTGSDTWANSGQDAVTVGAQDAVAQCTGVESPGVLKLSEARVSPGSTGTFAGTAVVPESGDLDLHETFKVGGTAPDEVPTAAGGVTAAPEPVTTAVATLHVAALPMVAVAEAGNGTSDYWLVTRFGDVVSGDDSKSLAPASGAVPTDITGIACPDAGGCWVVTGSGTVVPYGDAPAEAPESGYHAPTAGVVGIAAVPGGFLLAVSHGLAQLPEVVPFGTAAFENISVQLPLNQPIVAIAAASDGSGYWLLGADGGVFNSSGVSDHDFVGASVSSAVNDPRNTDDAQDFVGIAASPDDQGYTIVDAQGLVLTYGDATPVPPVTDSLPADASVVGMAPGSRTPAFADADALVR